MKKEKAIFCWSGGKDSALCLDKILAAGEYEVVCLLTTLNERFQRISMHGVRRELLEKQAEAIGLPLEKIFVSDRSSNDEYEEKMRAFLLEYKARGVERVIFGDIFLEDLRRWREANLAKVGMTGVFPLWKRDTRVLVEEFIALGFGSVVCCVNDAYLDETFLGRKIDHDFLRALPPGVDPCGENGEYHSFSYVGPIFRQDLRIEMGEKVYRPLAQMPAPTATHPLPTPGNAVKPQTKGFWFCDLLLNGASR
jgi:uncharacterized protein (TIGR00290 family)